MDCTLVCSQTSRPTFAEALVLAAVTLAAAQAFPKKRDIQEFDGSRIDEHAVMLSLDLVQGIAHDLQKVLVRGDDMPVQRKLDDRLSLADGFDLSHSHSPSVREVRSRPPTRRRSRYRRRFRHRQR